MTIFQINLRHGYKFLFSGLLFGFCMARIVALSMRIVWAAHPRNVSVGIASQIFTAAGVILLFVTNLVFAQRIIRAYHPFFGWHRAVGVFFKLLYGSIVAILIMVISVTVQSFFTLDGPTRRTDRDVQLFCATYLAVMSFLPIPLVLLAVMVPRRTRIDRFGQGHFRTKFALLGFTATLLAAGAIFRATVGYAVRPLNDPAWFQGKACYYCFNFMIELIVVYTYALSRFDKRFHVPNGSSAPGHYSCSEYDGALGSRSSVAGSLGSVGLGGGHSHGASAANIGLAGLGGLDDRDLVEKRVSYLGSSSYRPVSSKRNSAWSDKSTKSALRRSAIIAGGGGGSGSKAHSTKSVKSVHYGDTVLVHTPGAGSVAGGSQVDGITREADMEWMARAMRELYGENEEERGDWTSHAHSPFDTREG
ncbi:hypothetical protein B0T17DRAFT_526144 [Bombardia bombarda]|uniref:Uncharacterized protein n=1 Tax=Bombardia bombarda TaxID=252184 RepID=A0AA39X9P5_9PEZI|nr:hypothetical protein B0T17DRAFT_526144 [Bombardia bombarda]